MLLLKTDDLVIDHLVGFFCEQATSEEAGWEGSLLRIEDPHIAEHQKTIFS